MDVRDHISLFYFVGLSVCLCNRGYNLLLVHALCIVHSSMRVQWFLNWPSNFCKLYACCTLSRFGWLIRSYEPLLGGPWNKLLFVTPAASIWGNTVSAEVMFRILATTRNFETRPLWTFWANACDSAFYWSFLLVSSLNVYCFLFHHLIRSRYNVMIGTLFD